MRPLALILACAAAMPAAERQFTYLQESAVLAPGLHEVELGTTWQRGREDGSYRQMDARLEFETGIAPETQAAIYLNHRSVTTDGESSSSFDGISLELKRRFSDPDADGVGTALYLEGSSNSSEEELEFKAIADWHLGAWTVAANAIAEVEWSEEPDADGTGSVTRRTQEFTLSIGVARALPRGWSAGFEAEERNPVADGSWQSSTLWAGPAVHLHGEHMWGTLTILPQITNLGGDAPRGERELGDSSRWEARLILGTSL